MLAGPVASSGLLPAGYYRHLALAALEEEDFSRALDYLRWAQDPLLVQILVFRLRLLQFRHAQQQQALKQVLDHSPQAPRPKIQSLLAQEERAVEVLAGLEVKALRLLRDQIGVRGPEAD
ncbi:MAG: hypothetical protein JRI59_07420 [Deltaproteobacteria bacterium]|nr:hypothetical protein [Deltaproteobacteria bacterium]